MAAERATQPSNPERPGERLLRLGVYGSIAATVLVLVLALGPLLSAALITIAVETEVGRAAHLPWDWMLPAALEGSGGVALVNLIARKLSDGERAWCWFLVACSIAAGMAAQGTHAAWYDDARRSLRLPVEARVGVAFVPPLSAFAILHLVVGTIRDLIGQVGRLGYPEHERRPEVSLPAGDQAGVAPRSEKGASSSSSAGGPQAKSPGSGRRSSSLPRSLSELVPAVLAEIAAEQQCSLSEVKAGDVAERLGKHRDHSTVSRLVRELRAAQQAERAA